MYDILASGKINSKTNIFPETYKKSINGSTKKWMKDDLLALINKINDLYKEWKSTNDIVQYNRKKINFKVSNMNLNHNLQNFSDYLNKPSNIDFTLNELLKMKFIILSIILKTKIVRVKIKSRINY